jgi:hypothetical protein
MSARDAANTARLAAAKQDKAAESRAASSAATAAAARSAVTKLTSGGTLNAAEKKVLGITPTPTKSAGPTGSTGPTGRSTGPTGGPTGRSTGPTGGPTGSTGPTGPTGPAPITAIDTYEDPSTGDVYSLYSDGSTKLLSRGTKLSDEAAEAARSALLARQEAALALEEKKREGQSAYSLLFSEFDRYGLGTLVEPLKKFIEEGLSPAEFTIRLRETDAYKKRFAANAQRVAKGLRALSEAEYIGTEDQYQDVMRRYGMPESYYAKGDLGVQSGFEKFLAGDVSAVELEDRIQTAQNRVVNSNPEVAKALKEFYPGISNGDILAYVLDPANAIEQIKRKVTAAEIGGAAIQSGLKTGMTRAEELAAAGITKAQAQQGFQTVAEVAPRGGVLADIYRQDPYTQTTAEQEVFGLAGSVDAARQRKKLTQLETAAFSGSAGSGAIARDRAGAF